MSIFRQSVLSTAYFPPVEYFFAIAQSETVLIEQHEYYQKQSYRTRCNILPAGGSESLSVHILKEGNHSRPIRDIRLDYSDPWVVRHERAMAAAYNSSPFFEYYKDDFFDILESKPEFLFDLNLRLLEKSLELIGLKAEISLTESYLSIYPDNDFRERIHPKYKGESLMAEYKMEKPYFQVFSNKSGFIPNLSILDLLCAEGPNAISFLL